MPVSRGWDLNGPHLKLLRLGGGAGAGAAGFSSASFLAAASCSRWRPVWMEGAGAPATTLRGRTAQSGPRA